MAKIELNLLPSEVLLQVKDRFKRVLLLRASVFLLASMVVLTGLTLILRSIQRQSLQIMEKNLQSSQDKINSLQKQENLIFFRKSRLEEIQSASSQTSPYVQSYNLLNKLVPQGLVLSNVALSSTGQITLSVVGGDSAIKQFFNNLTDPQVNQNHVTSVKIENLSRNQTGIYSVDLEVSTK